MWGDAIRLDVMKGSGKIRELLKDLLEIEEFQLYEVDGLLNLGDLMYFYGVEKKDQLLI